MCHCFLLYRLDESYFTDLLDDKIHFSFIKRYKNPKGDILREDIIYSGVNAMGLINGEWKGKNCENKDQLSI